MARNKKNQVNIDLSDPVNYPDGRIKDNDGSGNGTPVNEKVYGDIHETFAKLMRDGLISFNDLPDSEQFGYQYVSALVQLAGKNDHVSLMSSNGGKLTIPINTAQLKLKESIVFEAATDYTAETLLSTFPIVNGSIDLLCNFKGGDFKNGEYIRIIKTSSGVDIVRLPDGDGFITFIEELNYLKAASQGEEDAGVINTKATTPLTNFTAFADRVIGAASVNFLATQIANGLMSAADKLKLDTLESEERNYGTFGPFDVNGNPVGTLFTRTGDVTEAKVTSTMGAGTVVQITMANAMDDTNYEIRISTESVGNAQLDNDVKPFQFKKISETKFSIYFEETGGVTQSIKIHLSAIQR